MNKYCCLSIIFFLAIFSPSISFAQEDMEEEIPFDEPVQEEEVIDEEAPLEEDASDQEFLPEEETLNQEEIAPEPEALPEEETLIQQEAVHEQEVIPNEEPSEQVEMIEEVEVTPPPALIIEEKHQVPPVKVALDFESARRECVDQINIYRSTQNLPPLQRWIGGEVCADNSAKQDSETGNVHESMGSCGDLAQNTCPNYDSTKEITSSCLQSMWHEGPPQVTPCTGQCFAEHGHFINMTNKAYTEVACGFYQMPDGKIYSNINFK